MTDNFIRHLIATIGTVCLLVVYIGGYMSAARGWWWTAFAIIFLYLAIYKLVDV